GDYRQSRGGSADGTGSILYRDADRESTSRRGYTTQDDGTANEGSGDAGRQAGHGQVIVRAGPTADGDRAAVRLAHRSLRGRERSSVEADGRVDRDGEGPGGRNASAVLDRELDVEGAGTSWGAAQDDIRAADEGGQPWWQPSLDAEVVRSRAA